MGLWKTNIQKELHESPEGQRSLNHFKSSSATKKNKSSRSKVASRDKKLMVKISGALIKHYMLAFTKQCADRRIVDNVHLFWEQTCDVRVQSCDKYKGSGGKLIQSEKWAVLRRLLKQLMIAAKVEIKGE
jgi:hypothetical protein